MAKLDPQLGMLLAKKKYYEQNADLYEALPSSQKLEDPVNVTIQLNGKPTDLDLPQLDLNNYVGNIVYTRVSLQALEVLAEHPQVLVIERQRKENLTLDTSVHDIGADLVWSRSGDSFSGFSGKDVIVGVIDTGIDFRHGSFRKADNTRVLKIWDQTLTPTGSEVSPAAIVDATGTSAMGYGVEYSWEDINKVLQNAPGAPAVRHKDTNSHGTHVAGIAAGDGSQSGNCKGGYSFIGVAPDADLIVVRKIGLTTGDNLASLPSGTRATIDALRYIINEANTFNKPVVINMSFGAFTEAMNGTSGDCQTMDQLLEANPAGCVFVVAAGNDGANNFHAKTDVPAAGTLSIRFKTFPDDTKTRELVVLYSGSNLSIQLTSPLGTATGQIAWVGPATPFTQSTTANGANGQVNITQATDRIGIQIVPPPPPPPAAAPGKNVAGDWLIELRADDGVTTAINAFCLYGSGHDSRSVKFKDFTTKQSTLTEQGTGQNVLTVGSYQDENGALASSSGRGMTLDFRVKPDITAPGVGILSVASMDATDGTGNYRSCCCDCCEDSYKTMSGTSMASPHVAGAVALLLQKDKTLGFDDIKLLLGEKARPAPGGAPTDDVMGWGSGKLTIKAAIDEVTALTPGGGGGGGPDHFKTPARNEWEHLQERFLHTYRGKRLKGLLQPFFLEIRTLINTNKKIATVWHRSKGPAWMSAAFRSASQPDMPVPQTIEGLSLKDCAQRVAAILKKYCSPLLFSHLEECEADLLRMKEGMNIYQLIGLLEEPAMSTA